MKLLALLKKEWLQLIILVAPFVIIAIFYTRLPNSIPVHWNMRGEANRYGDKSTELFTLPLINILLAVVLGKLRSIDPKAARLNFSDTTMRSIRLLVTSFLFLLFVAMIAIGLGVQLDMAAIPKFGVMIFLMLMGNLLPKVRPNYFVGVRTPWTLEDPEIWRRTHNFTGHFWVLMSIVGIVLELLADAATAKTLFFLYLAAIVIVPIMYSYVLYQRTRKHAV